MIAAAVAVLMVLGADEAAKRSLGEQLFEDTRFSSTQGDMLTSCASCHLPSSPQGYRAFTEFLSRSWVPWRKEDPRRETLRNTPTILDTRLMPLLHFDGEFKSLEEQASKTLVGRNLGWLPSEREQAVGQIRSVILDPDPANTYPEQFLAAYGVDLSDRTAGEIHEWVSRAISDFVRSLKAKQNSPYDTFLAANGLSSAPRDNEQAKAYGAGLLAAITSLQAGGTLKHVKGFGPVETAGLKIFFRTDVDRMAGNCVACHVPPNFTDFEFHNTGVAEDQYDAAHGAKSFAALEIPELAEANRPERRFLERASKREPGHVDLGFWNFVDVENGPQRLKGESADALLSRTVATFKTPTLRNLSYTAPYLHSGNYGSLEAVVARKARHVFKQGATISIGDTSDNIANKGNNSATYRAKGQGGVVRDFPVLTRGEAPKSLSPLPPAETLRNIDPEFVRINITPGEIVPLVAFLKSLSDRSATTASQRDVSPTKTGAERRHPAARRRSALGVKGEQWGNNGDKSNYGNASAGNFLKARMLDARLAISQTLA